jgi:hypothetical protein
MANKNVARVLAWRKKHPKKLSAQTKRYNKKHRARIAKRSAAWYVTNKERIARRLANKWATDAKFREASIARAKKWRLENPERVKALAAAQRLKRGGGIPVRLGRVQKRGGASQ